MMMEKFKFSIFTLVLVNTAFVTCLAATDPAIRAHVGSTVRLPCRVDEGQCGQLHSVKWYKDADRVYVLSHAGQGRAEGDATERMEVKYDKNSAEAVLKIDPIEAEDEAIYKCEITYLEVIDNCAVVQIVELKTLKKPESVKVLLNDGKSYIPQNNGSMLASREEGDELDLICVAEGGKPVPKVKWYNGTTEVTRAEYTMKESGDGTGMGRSRLQLALSRGDLLAKFECRVESEALDEPIVSSIITDVTVRPIKVDLYGVQSHVVQGTNVLLMCDVYGARPKATVRWANGSYPIADNLIQTAPQDKFKLTTEEIKERDGTTTIKSSLFFKASHWENGRTIYCYAENEVMKKNAEPELHASLIMDVRYPPVITVRPLNITINESFGNSSVLLNCVYFANPQELKGITWAKDGINLTLSDTSKYVGGTTQKPPLFINNVTRDDMGNYSCSLRNEVGSETSDDRIFLNVQYPPGVDLMLEPSVPVKAVDRSTVLMICNVTSGNPSTLLKVRWFLDGELMKEIPECNYTSYDETGAGEGNGGPYCGVDPSIMSLEKVDESFSGNYTCQGKNVAGWGPESEPQELIVYYPPSPAKLRYYPSRVVKGGSVTLECTVDNPGRPENVTYIWHRGSPQMAEISTSNFTISPVRLETRSNFTCTAVNEGGESQKATVFINVNAPPAFIQKLPPYQGVLYSSQYINLTCRVECFPLCSIEWQKDGVKLDIANNPLYYVKTERVPPDYQNNDFESVNSTLIWNLTAWPGNKLNKTAPNSNYTCLSQSNSVGVGVGSKVELAVDYPPEELTVSSRVVNVIEKQKPSPVKCHGKGRPALSYRWRKNATSDAITDKDELILGEMSRSDTGGYYCEASNKHGTQTAVVYFNVQYLPECSISTVEKDGSPALVCTVHANPQEVTFTWKVREGNETFVESTNIIQDGLKSFLLLDSSIDTFRTYSCYANNSVGTSNPCERDVAGNLPWWKQLNQDKMILIIASIIAIIILVIIICIIIIILCRRKRADTKSPNPSYIEDKARLGPAPPAGGTVDPLSDPDKGFYENLPFHGMQNPPNKTNGTTTTGSDTYIF